MGDTCTRSCGFCKIKTGRPAILDPEEPRRVGESVQAMNLQHAVLTSVNRDEQPTAAPGSLPKAFTGSGACSRAAPSKS